MNLDPWLFGQLTSPDDAPIVADPGNGNPIVVTGNARIYLTVGVGAETNTLPAPPKGGLSLLVSFDVDGGGSRAIQSASALDAAGNTLFTVQNPDQSMLLRSMEVRTEGVSVFHWVVDINFGALVAP